MSSGGWVIQARNNEKPPGIVGAGDWDTKWYTIDDRAFSSWDIDAFKRPFEVWIPMDPTFMEACVEAMVSLRRKWVAEHGHDVATFRLLNVVTGEVVPQELFETQ